MNGIIIDGKVYEAIENGTCPECDFDNDESKCRPLCDTCEEWNCAFRYSQSLTDKLNSNGFQQEDTSAGL